MKLAVIHATRPGEIDACLWHSAQRLGARGLRLCGSLHRPAQGRVGRHCDLDLVLLPSGQAMQIAQRLGPGARGCRMDGGALETAVMQVSRSFEAGADLLIVNKFGKHEAEGRGFHDLIVRALAEGTPVLCATNALNRAAFDAFASGLAHRLPATADAIEQWALAPQGAQDGSLSAEFAPALPESGRSAPVARLQ